MSLQDAIEHPFFDSVRNDGEKCNGKPIILEFEESEMTKETVVELIEKEINKYHKK